MTFSPNYVRFGTFNKVSYSISSDTADSSTIKIIDPQKNFEFTCMPTIKHIHYNDPYTCVIFTDGSKSIVKCKDDEVFDKETGLAMALTKKYFELISPNHGRSTMREFVDKAYEGKRK